jgi:hypothetical protein
MDQDRRGQKMLRTGWLSGCMSQKPTGVCLHHCCLVYVKTLCHVGGLLAIAWNLGAFRWTQQLRVDYANDLAVVLLASTEPPTGKTDDGPREWMPPDKRNWCKYGDRFGMAWLSRSAEVKVSRRAGSMMASADVQNTLVASAKVLVPASSATTARIR